jgi:lipopolysaccharide/colanic/teichoic acid biosynthesis glycosyltransferase
LIFLPFGIIISIFIVTGSRGGIFYSQQRVGKNGVKFGLLKFRTMKPNSDKLGQLTLGMRDPRITKIGYFLRKTKMDEFPQFLNVIRGQMSIVGPRPDIKGYYDKLEGDEQKILLLKPGLTSLASIKYSNEDEILKKQFNPLKYNDEVIFPDKVKMNLDYYYNHSFFIDLKIILKTIFR